MTSLEDRKAIVEAAAEARDGGARLAKVSEIIGGGSQDLAALVDEESA